MFLPRGYADHQAKPLSFRAVHWDSISTGPDARAKADSSGLKSLGMTKGRGRFFGTAEAVSFPSRALPQSLCLPNAMRRRDPLQRLIAVLEVAIEISFCSQNGTVFELLRTGKGTTSVAPH